MHDALIFLLGLACGFGLSAVALFVLIRLKWKALLLGLLGKVFGSRGRKAVEFLRQDGVRRGPAFKDHIS